MTGLSFATPWVLVLVPVVVVISWWGGRRKRRAAALYSSTTLIAPLRPTLRQRLAFVPSVLRTIGLVAIVVALARPRIGIGEVRTSADAVAIMMAVDRSLSMELPMTYAGKQGTRLDVVKSVFREFVEGNGRDLDGRREDLIGLVSFAGFAGTVCPLVRIHTTLVDLADSIDLARDDLEQGTAIGDGLALAAARLKSAEEELAKRNEGKKDPDFTIKSKIIVLLTDGDENRGVRASEAAKLCKEWGIKVYAIGIGDNQGGRVRTASGMVRLMPGQGFNESLLKQVAQSTGGKYWRASSGESLREIYGEIDRLEKTEIRATEFTSYHEAFGSWAELGGGLIALELVLGATLLRRVP